MTRGSVTCDATSGPCQHVTRDTALHNYEGMHTLDIILIRPKCSVFTQINTFHGLFFLKIFDSFELLEIFFRQGYLPILRLCRYLVVIICVIDWNLST